MGVQATMDGSEKEVRSSERRVICWCEGEGWCALELARASKMILSVILCSVLDCPGRVAEEETLSRAR